MIDRWIGEKGASYSDFVWRAVTNNTVFANFRRHRTYMRILEHVTAAQGEDYLSLISDPVLKGICFESEFADTIGNPQTALYEGRNLSPTTLRYGKVANDLVRLFPGFASLKSICEIGVGYGGQARVLSEYSARGSQALAHYELMDLPEVLMLAGKYLQHFHFRHEFAFRSIIEMNASSQGCDLVISNYAFSEFNRPLQQEYLEKVVLKARSGYLTMNSGAPAEPEPRRSSCISQAELLTLLPNSKLLQEVPLTSANNYILVFGDHSA